MELRRKRVTLSRNPAPVQRNASPFLHDVPLLCKSQWNSGANGHVTHPWKVTLWSSPQRQCHRERIRTLANCCGRLRTQKQRPANAALPSDSQVKREPFATHSGKNWLWRNAHTQITKAKLGFVFPLALFIATPLRWSQVESQDKRRFEERFRCLGLSTQVCIQGHSEQAWGLGTWKNVEVVKLASLKYQRSNKECL